VVELGGLKSGRGNTIVNSFNQIKKMFPSNINEITESTSIIISKTTTNKIINIQLAKKVKTIMNEKLSYNSEICNFINRIIDG
jgi:ubiquinone biosynthesis protein Coq4